MDSSCENNQFQEGVDEPPKNMIYGPTREISNRNVYETEDNHAETKKYRLNFKTLVCMDFVQILKFSYKF